MKLGWLLRIVKQHTKFPLCSLYYRNDPEAHNHICYAARLLGSDLPKVCPQINHALIKGRKFEPEWENACDGCKYLGTVDFPNGEMRIWVNRKISELY